MPSGQASTTWFPEMKDMLPKLWNSYLSIEEHFVVVSELNVKLKEIRERYNVEPPMFTCKKCNQRHRSKFSYVTLTSLYFALDRFDIIEHRDFNKLLREWKKYSVENSIDNYHNYKDWNFKKRKKLKVVG